MKKILKFFCVVFAGGLLIAGCAKESRMKQTETLSQGAAQVPGGLQVEKSDYFYVYRDAADKANHYIPSGWMGDHGDMKLNQNFTGNPKAGKNCVEITYNAKKSHGAGWVGIFWQNPANNWGDVRGGYNLTGAKRLTFWGRGAKGGEYITEFKVGGIKGVYSDSDSVSIGPVTFTSNWQKYTINLSGIDLSYISGGFCWAASGDFNPEGFTIYLDEIRYEFK